MSGGMSHVKQWLFGGILHLYYIYFCLSESVVIYIILHKYTILDCFLSG